MASHVCPWWMGWMLASPLRRLWLNPTAVFSPYVKDGMTVLEPGPGMGFLTLELARLVGTRGRVVAVDVQPKMLDGLKRRLAQKGLRQRVDARLVPEDSMRLDDLAGAVDFAVAFNMVHELPSAARFFQEVAAALKPGGKVLVVEPRGHVSHEFFEAEMRDAAGAGLALVDRPRVGRSPAALLQRTH